MDSTRQHLEERQVGSAGLAAEFRQLKEDGGASAAELQEFLGQLKGRSPEEVMGAVAQSGLVQSTLMATVGCAVLLLVFTAVPYVFRDTSVAKKEPASTSSDAATTNAAAIAETADVEETTTSSTEPDLERAANAMGISGAADADPNSNPLDRDSKLDKLLDGIE